MFFVHGEMRLGGNRDAFRHRRVPMLGGGAWNTGRGKDTPLVASFVRDTGGAPALRRWQFGGAKMRGKAAARALAVAGDANQRA